MYTLFEKVLLTLVFTMLTVTLILASVTIYMDLVA